jgi:hypothetical protein
MNDHHNHHHPPEPIHISGNNRGEEMNLRKGREAGRGDQKQYRASRDATGINASDRRPIDPRMPSIPPA